MGTRRSVLYAVICVLSVAIAACGGGPSGPSSAEGVTLSGRIVGSPVGFVSASSGASSAAMTITVTVSGTSISTNVTTDGSFTLRGLPEGTFTLEFVRTDPPPPTPLGTLTFTDVKPNQQITINVEINGTTVSILEERRNGIGHGDVEIEGLVQTAPAVPNPAAENVFTIDGYTVVTRPLQTAIREGNRSRTVADVTVGRQVHVKGVWETNSTGGQQVFAHEIKLQGPGNGGDDGGGQASFCPDAGRKAEVEGKITTKDDAAMSLTVHQQGKGDFLAQANGSTRIRKGNTNLTFAQLAPGNRVHVKGTSLGLSGAACAVQATEIKLQN